ncbi:capsid protein [Wuhan house centipede virus 6]|uniref:capsid protein n=1 Tax=Wuhan house centipede virus 6 TaxID=1923710 RepID=UPI00090B4009|nr:capsid protein [Wuhan house centipede virus 6]APG76094.1 hypothetical protein 1 [Wuhan house centipede virus 6]APG76247.1 capsid protein [Wuhan house centipede virus 6]APG76562.1 capsid protein [Wuhan house centipede virus 6]
MVNKNNQKARNGKTKRKTRNGQLQATREGPASSRSGMRTGIPRIRNRDPYSIEVCNTEIAMTITGTAAGGIIPAGGNIKIMRFDDSSTGNALNNKHWITKLGLAYDKFVIEELSMKFVPSLPFTAAGMSAMYFDSDPSRTTPPTSVASVSGDMRAVSKQIYAELPLKVLRNQLNRLPQYETFPGSGDTGVATVGSINFVHDSIAMPNASTTGNITIGNVWMTYRIRLINPSNAVA